jgi:hypothetical protein
MDRQKILKNKIVNNIKMDTNNIMQFKNFEGHNNFNAVIDPINKTTKREIETMINNSKCNKNFYFEWTTYKSKVKPYYDVDMFYTDKDEYEKNIPIIENEVTQVLKKLYPETDIAICSSHGKKTKIKTVKKVKEKIEGFAISYHFVCADYETNVEDLRSFNEKNKLYDIKFNNTNEKMFDKSVYRDGGNMRMIYSYKPNDERQKIPINYKEDFAITKHIIQSSDATNHFKRPLPIASPPVSPTTSDDDVREDDDVIDADVKDADVKDADVKDADVKDADVKDDDFEFVVEPVKRTYDAGELQDILNILPDECYEYDPWIKVGMAIHNITEGNNIGSGLYINWSKKDKGNFDLDLISKNWKYWGKKKTGNKLGLTYLRNLRSKYQPQNSKSLKCIYESTIEETKSKKKAKDAVLKEMNNRVIFVKETGDYIILDKKIIRKANEELITMPCWYLKNATKAKDHFQKENDKIYIDDGEGNLEGIKIEPFKWWCEWIDRKEVRAIGFDPRDNANSDLFNLWNGFNISKEVADEYDEKDAEPILNHIKTIWCKDDENAYNYVIDYLSHIIQKPHVKTGVLLALKSKQGGGKGIILEKLAQIIGDAHYAQNSNANFLFGDFNGQLEGKILINLDEAFWGGDKKLEGVIKNKITETKQTINKKNKENYMVDCYANYIITTNNDWFAGTTEDDRRHFCLECDNRYASRSTKEKDEYFSPIYSAPCEAFAKVLYNRDIQFFKPRQFKKTDVLQTQVEMNWNSPKVFWNKVMKEGGFEYDGHFIEWGKTLTVCGDFSNKTYGVKLKNKNRDKHVVYEKDWLFKCYDKQNYNGRKFDNASFWREIQKNDGCLGNLYVELKKQLKKERKIYVFLPSLEEARKKWNEIQEYEYNYGNEDDDEWEIDDGFSDDE